MPESPGTGIGVGLDAVCAPLPSCPSWPAPQQYTTPLCDETGATTPHAVGPLTLMLMKVCAPPICTCTGTSDCGTNAGLPSWPKVLSPQQYAAPTTATPHVFMRPAEIWRQTMPPSTGMGVVALARTRLPSCPRPS